MSENLNRLLEIMEYLRSSPDGCVWTKEQTHKSLTRHLIEEAHETADAIDQEQIGDELRDELGDILLQVAFHAEIAKERGAFNFDDIAKSIADKLVRRYPTILGDEPNTLKTPEEIDRRWNEIKAEERKAKGLPEKQESILDEIPYSLPALLRSQKLKERAAKAGFDWNEESGVFDKINEELGELREELEAKTIDKEKIADEIGDLMFMMVNLARWYDIDAEDALRRTNNKFERRFKFIEQKLKEIDKSFNDTSLEEQTSFWNEAKKLEKKQN